MQDVVRRRRFLERLRIRNTGAWLVAGLMIVPPLAVAYTYHLLTSSVPRTTLVNAAVNTIGPQETVITPPEPLKRDRDNAALVLQLDPGEVTISKEGAQLLEGKGTTVRIRVRLVDEKGTAYELEKLGPEMKGKFALSYVAAIPSSASIKEVHLSADHKITITKVQWHRWAGAAASAIK